MNFDRISILAMPEGINSCRQVKAVHAGAMHKFEYAFYQESSLNAVQTWVNGKAKEGFELHSFIGVGEGFAAAVKKDLQLHATGEEADLKKVDLPDRNYSVPAK